MTSAIERLCRTLEPPLPLPLKAALVPKDIGVLNVAAALVLPALLVKKEPQKAIALAGQPYRGLDFTLEIHGEFAVPFFKWPLLFVTVVWFHFTTFKRQIGDLVNPFTPKIKDQIPLSFPHTFLYHLG